MTGSTLRQLRHCEFVAFLGAEVAPLTYNNCRSYIQPSQWLEHPMMADETTSHGYLLQHCRVQRNVEQMAKNKL